MPFQYPATELYDAGGVRRVVWSQEEFDWCLKEGWSECPPAPAVAPEPEQPKRRAPRRDPEPVT